MYASDVLSREQAVALLAQAGETLPALAQAGLSLSLLGRDTCTLMRPESPGSRADRAALAALDSLLQEVVGAARWSREPGVNPANLWTLGQAVIHILLNAPPLDRDEAVPPADERLLILREAPDWLEARLLDIIHADATQLRFAPASDGEGKRLLLVMVRDDVDRGSLFGALQEAGALDAARVLHGYGQPVRLFVPDGVALAPRLLADALAVFTHAEALFDLPPTKGSRPQLAFDAEPVADGRRWRIKTLVPVDPSMFLADERLWPEAGEYARLELLSPVPDPARQRTIVQTLRAHKVQDGYRLRLVRGLPSSVGQAELERLAAQVQELELELQAKRGLAHDDLVLLRFGIADLPALAALLRQMPPRDLSEGNIRYAFQAVRGGEGEETHRHFLLFDAGRVGHLSGVFDLAWRRPGAPTLSFWVDPVWRSSYGALLGGPIGSRVFVPHGSVLQPSLHSWAGEDMDGYLRSVLPALSGAATKLPFSLPQSLFYVFEEEADGSGRIGLQVLDPSLFQPLEARMGFLNDMLVLYDTLGEDQLGTTTQLVESLAREVRHHPVLRHLQAETVEREEAMDALTGRATARALAQVTMMLEAIEAQMETAVETITTHGERLAEIHDTLASVTHELQRAETSVGEVAQTLRDAPKTARTEAKRHAETIRRVEVLARDTEMQHQATLALIEQRLAWLGDQVRRARRLRL